MTIKDRCTGRWESILNTLGVDEKILNSRHQACPGCGGDDRFKFTDHKGTGAYICSQCGNGSGFDLLMLCFGWDFARSAKEIELIIGGTKVIEKKKHDPLPMLRFVQKNAAYGPETVKYLRGRGLNPINCLRQVQLTYYDEDRKPVGKFDCMTALVVDVDNQPVTYHVTFLKDGKKAEVPNPKKMLPGKKSPSGCAVRLGPDSEELNITEGIETGLAVLEMTKRTTWAALNANGMEKIKFPENIKKVHIWGDNDKSYTGQKAAYVLANRIKTHKDTKHLEVEVHIPEKPQTDWLDYFNMEYQK